MTDPRPVPPLLREQLRLGELAPDVARDVRRRLALETEDPHADLPDDAQTFADDPPDAVVREVRRRAAEADWQVRRSSWRSWVPALLVTATVLLVVGRVVTTPVDPGDDIVLKGERARLWVYREEGARAVPLGQGAVAHVGDKLQLAFAAPGTTYGVLYSVDGRGAVTEHLRFAGAAAVNGRRVVPEAYVLDDAPSYEAFHLVAGTRPFDIDGVLSRARARGATPAPPSMEGDLVVATLVVPKE